MPVRQFPFHPNLDQLRHQAKDRLRALRNGDPAAIDDFRAHHSPGFDLADATLADAQLVLARSYQASSWPEADGRQSQVDVGGCWTLQNAFCPAPPTTGAGLHQKKREDAAWRNRRDSIQTLYLLCG